MSESWDVVIVGAGVCGLTTALALQRHGLTVAVLEKRSDAALPDARHELEAAARAMARINELAVDPESLPGELEQVRNVLLHYWGIRERNVLVDTHTLSYLAALGVDVHGFRHLEHTSLDGMEGDLTLSVGFSPQEILPEHNGLDADRIILQRDFSAQPTLGALERRLRESIQGLSRVCLRFDHRVVQLAETAEHVVVQMDDGRSVRGRYLIVADGGAASSLARSTRWSEAPGKIVHTSEPVSVAIFRVKSGQRVLGYDLTRTFTHTMFTTHTWTGLFCNGTNLTVAVNDPCPGDPRRSEAMVRMQVLGFNAPLAEPPFQMDAEIAVAHRFTSGRRILIAGDAAMTGNPRFGLGVQYSVLWAQRLDTLFGEAITTSRDLDITSFEAYARQVTERRKGYEEPWLVTMADFMNNGWSFSDPDVAAAIMAGMQSLSVDMASTGSVVHLACTLRHNFQEVHGVSQHAIVEVLQSYGSITLGFDLEIETAVEGANGPFSSRARLSREHPIEFAIGGQCWSIEEGTIGFRRVARGWELALYDTAATQYSLPQGRYETSRMPMKNMSMSIPDTLLDRMLGFAPDKMTAAVLYDRPLSFEFDVAEEAELQWGPLHVRSEDHSRLRLTVSRHGRGTPRIGIEVLRGRLTPVSFTGFARNSGLSAARWVDSWSRLTRGVFDGVMDAWGRLAGGTIRGLSMDFALDGSAIATLSAVVPVSVYLSAADTQKLRKTLTSSAALAHIISNSPGFVRTMRTTIAEEINE